MKTGIVELPIRFIMTRDWLDTEMRVRINQDKVEQYAEEMASGDNFPPPVVYIHKGKHYVGDGFHRILAKEMNGAKSLDVDLRCGTQLDAILHNIDANRKQRGLPFSRGDLERAILTLLTRPDTKNWSQSKIASTVGASQGYTSQVVSKFNVERPEYVTTSDGKLKRKSAPRDEESVAERHEQIMELYTQGVPKIEIARQLNIARWAVQQHIYKATNENTLTKCPHCHGSGYVREEVPA